MIKVKALEWRLDYDRVIGECGECRYMITQDFLSDRWLWLRGRHCTDAYPSLDDAKAACQAHHEKHVLSMITEVADGAE